MGDVHEGSGTAVQDGEYLIWHVPDVACRVVTGSGRRRSCAPTKQLALTTSKITSTATGHPRPDRRRARWADLNGTWEFSFDEPTFDRTIVVPFVHQSTRSTIGDTTHHDVCFYRRRFTPPDHAPGERVLVHFGAVDFAATVWVDGTEVGRHRGGHTSFTCDLTDALDAGSADHELRVQVIDEYRGDQLRGKQTKTFPFFIHYTASSGIWQSVFCEVTGSSWIDEYRIVADAHGTVTVGADVIGDTATTLGVTIGDDDLVLHGPVGTELHGRLEGARTWSPDDPALYDLRVEVLDGDGRVLDTVQGHVGFRTVTVAGDRWLCNGRPLYQRLLLDQGYWPESLLTPPSDDALVADLGFVRDAGFNGVRKHQKIADPRFLWHADRMGVLVWEELPSPFWLAHLDGDLEADAIAEWTEAIRRDRNHPCIIAWVPLNESWGVQDLHRVPERRDTVRRLVAVTRGLDDTRPVVDNSGWGHVDTDIVDVHDYDQNPERLTRRWTGIEARGWDRGPAVDEGGSSDADDVAGALERWRAHIDPPEADLVDDRWMIEAIPDTAVWAPGCVPAPGTAGPLVLSEIGGVGLAFGEPPADVFEYSKARDADDLMARFVAIIGAVEQIPEAVGWCWTELADVEQEINGLLTADRHPKIDPARLRAALAPLPWSVQGLL